jgi:hypothetical protein
MAITLTEQRAGLGNRSEQRAGQRVRIRTPSTRFEVDLSKKPPGMAYEWKAKYVLGAENIEGMVNYEANGWVAVPAGRHEELSGKRLGKDAEIVRGGQILMERPEEISTEARDLDGKAARTQVSDQLQRLGLAGHRAAGRGLKRSYAPPEDDFVTE